MKISGDNNGRTQTFRRNPGLEDLLSSLNGSLSSAEHEALGNYSVGYADHPVVFVMGPHRSGTTLFMQWLAKSGMVAYPTNLLSRFYGAPVIGAQIQQLLTDPQFNFRNEILDFNSEISFESENGKTTGALAPNEFWYFWRRFLPFQDLDWLPDEELFRVVDRKMLVNELVTLTRIFRKPFALKSMILNYNIPFLNTIFKKALFIQVKRDPIMNVASILEARKRQMGDSSKWYSFKIAEYPELKDHDAITQSAGQVHYINKAITRGMESVDASRKLVVQYEDFCEDPHQTHKHLITILGIDKPDSPYTGPGYFKVTRATYPKNGAKIEKALSQFYANG